MKIAIVLGTRPEIIKLSSIIRECKKHSLNYFILHTNQHYSARLDEIFFDDLELPPPRYNLNIGSGSHSEEVGKMMIGIEKILQKEKPSLILVQGDTNTVLAGALAASKLHIPVGHVEAGLRSFDRRMPEEINRVLADHISERLFAPTKQAKEQILKEGISKNKILVSGNTIVDAIFQNLNIAEKKKDILKKLRLNKQNYFLVTCHRPSNVDNKDNFFKLLREFGKLYRMFKIPLIFPIHPRSSKMLKKFRLNVPAGLNLIEPAGYLEFLQLEKNAKLILTDSGGIQEEACILKVPCITLRENTERLETIYAGANMLMGENLCEDCQKMIEKNRNWQNPFGNGDSGKKIVKYILEKNERIIKSSFSEHSPNRKKQKEFKQKNPDKKICF